MTDEQKSRISMLRAKDLSYKEITDSFGLTKAHVAGFCRRNNLMTDDPVRVNSTPSLTTCKNCGRPISEARQKANPVMFE